jgi:hypothetical protein
MPSPTTTELPIPKSWDEFEDICADLLKRLWRDPYVVRNGRSGQKQHGVDIYGKPVHLKDQGTETAAAQCKRVDALTEDDVKKEIEQAAEFQPKLQEYILFTTLKRDANLQEYVRTQRWAIPRVEILFWEDLSLQLSGFDELLKKHFPRWFQSKTSKDDLIQMLVEAVPDDFEYDDSVGQYLHKRDVGLQLRMNRPVEMQPFEEPWVSNFPDPKGYQQEVYLEYGGTRIETFWFADVDGGRYLIPYPKAENDLRISPFQYHLACIVNRRTIGLGIDHGLRVAGITVDAGVAT